MKTSVKVWFGLEHITEGSTNTAPFAIKSVPIQSYLNILLVQLGQSPAFGTILFGVNNMETNLEFDLSEEYQINKELIYINLQNCIDTINIASTQTLNSPFGIEWILNTLREEISHSV